MHMYGVVHCGVRREWTTATTLLLAACVITLTAGWNTNEKGRRPFWHSPQGEDGTVPPRWQLVEASDSRSDEKWTPPDRPYGRRKTLYICLRSEIDVTWWYTWPSILALRNEIVRIGLPLLSSFFRHEKIATKNAWCILMYVSSQSLWGLAFLDVKLEPCTMAIF